MARARRPACCGSWRVMRRTMPDQCGGADGPARPSSPERLPVDAWTATSSGLEAQRRPRRWRASRPGDRPPSRGRAPTMVRSSARDRDRQPASARVTTARSSSPAVDAPVAGSPGRERARPRSPSRAAARSAVARAWSTTSPSEWPCSRGRFGDQPPPRRRPSSRPEGVAVRPPEMEARSRWRRRPAGRRRSPRTSSEDRTRLGHLDVGRLARHRHHRDAVAREQLLLVAEHVTGRRRRHRWRQSAAPDGQPGASGPGTASPGPRSPVTRPSVTCFSESTTGSTGMAAPCSAAACGHAVGERRGRQRSRGVMDQHHLAVRGPDAVRDGIWRRAPPATTVTSGGVDPGLRAQLHEPVRARRPR